MTTRSFNFRCLTFSMMTTRKLIVKGRTTEKSMRKVHFALHFPFKISVLKSECFVVFVKELFLDYQNASRGRRLRALAGACQLEIRRARPLYKRKHVIGIARSHVSLVQLGSLSRWPSQRCSCECCVARRLAHILGHLTAVRFDAEPDRHSGFRGAPLAFCG
jgi:hypothetical protein